MKKKICLLFTFVLILSFFHGIGVADSPEVRIKDIASVKEARDNQLIGFGLVAGLRLTGDSQQVDFTRQALTGMLSKMGIANPTPANRYATDSILSMANMYQSTPFKSKNVAAVMVTAILPAFIKPGQKIDVTVSSIGDATSLKGGTLVETPLGGLDGQVYAVAQGPVSLGNTGNTSLYPFNNEVLTSGRVPSGAIVEKEVPVNFEDILVQGLTGEGYSQQPSVFTILLNEPDFTTSSRVAYSIAKEGIDSRAEDAASILVKVAPGEDVVSLISRVENLKVVPDVAAKIVINERTGTIVIGENIRIAPVAVTYGNISVSIGGVNLASGTGQQQNTTTSVSNMNIVEKNKKLVQIKAGANLGALIRSLNAIGATSKDLIAILQAIKASGALTAQIEVI